MAWKVLSNLKTDVLHKVDEVLHTLEGLTDEEIKKLEQEGIIQNLEADGKTDVNQVKTQVEQDVHTVETQAEQDAELARGQVDSQVHAAAQQDIADTEALAKVPGDPVVNNQAKPGQPTPEEIAATAANVQ
jgi:hypothetical protein